MPLAIRADPYSLTGNAGLKLDLWVMGDKHLYHGEGIPFDPEGILSTLPSIVNVMAGYLAEYTFSRKDRRMKRSPNSCLRLHLIFLSLCWNMVFPIGKIMDQLLCSHYSRIDLLLLSALIFIIEISGKKSGPISLRCLEEIHCSYTSSQSY
jgi:predicted acyltransferase